MTETERKNAENTRGKPFKSGNSGRPKGSLNRVTLAIQFLLDGEGEELNPESYLVGQGMSIASHLVLIDSSIKNDYNSPLRFAKKSRNPAKGRAIVGQKIYRIFYFRTTT